MMALRGGPGDGHQVEDGDADPQEQQAGFREAEHGVADGSADQAEGEGGAFAERLTSGFDQARAVEAGEDGDEREGEADGAVGPADSGSRRR